MSAPNAHRARTDLIGGAKPREVISDADGRALEMTGTGRTAGAAEFALSPGFTAHSRESGHPIIRSAEPGEDWSWCVVDEVAFVVSPGDGS